MLSFSKNLSRSILEIHDSQENHQAQPSSAQSDNSLISLRANFTKPWEALIFLYISTKYKFWETDILVKSIAHRAYANNYNGLWRTVQAMLEAELTSPEQFQQEFIKHRSSCEFFGNLLRRVPDFESKYLIKVSPKEDKRPVKRPQRKRGYADKGSCRLPHEKHGDPKVPREREDRRNLIFHPLLRGID